MFLNSRSFYEMVVVLFLWSENIIILSNILLNAGYSLILDTTLLVFSCLKLTLFLLIKMQFHIALKPSKAQCLHL